MKRNIKKTIAIVLAISMLSSSNILVFANQLTPIEQIMQSPDTVLTKGQFTALLNSSLKLENGSGENFKDVSPDSPYFKDLLIAKTTGYLKGDGFGSVYPDQLISGAEAITCINFFLGFDMSKVNIINGLNVPTWAQAPASNLIDLTIIDKTMAEKKTITVDDAKKLVGAISTALMFPDSPFKLKQASLQDDFYAYTNRQFMATATVPVGYPGVEAATPIILLVENQISNIIKDVMQSSNLTVNSDEWKAKEIYNMYMDNESRTKSFEKVKPILSEIKNANSLSDLAVIRNKYQNQFNLVSKLISENVDADAKVDATKWAYLVSYSKLSLPTKDYYEDNANLAPIQTAYKKLLAQRLAYMGETENLEARAEAFYNLEKSLGNKQKSLAEQSNYPSKFNPSSWDEIDKLTTNINKDIVLDKALDSKVRSLNVYCYDKDYVKFADSLYTEQNLGLLKDMMMLNVIGSVGTFLGDDYQNLDKELVTAMVGTYSDSPENIKAQNIVKTLMPMTISKLYTEKYTSPKVKEDVTKMCEEIRNTRIERVKQLNWMSQKTKDAAIEKLKAIKLYIAYPDKFDKDLDFDIVSKDNGGTLIDVFLKSQEANVKKSLIQLEKAANSFVWERTTPYTVNAFYNPFSNSVIIPNGILSAPIYDANGDTASNLGGIGAMIGHEFTHAIDSNGALFDKNGTIANWWTDEDYKAFQNLTNSVATELSKISIGEGMQINGQLTAAEQVADLGGLAASISIAEDNNLDTASVLKNWANVWGARYPKQLVHYLLSDVHAPGMVRANFTVAQQDAFYKAFNIKPEDKMYVAPEKRLNIW